MMVVKCMYFTITDLRSLDTRDSWQAIHPGLSMLIHCAYKLDEQVQAAHVAYRHLPKKVLCCWIKLLSTCMNLYQLVAFVDHSKHVLLQSVVPEVPQPTRVRG